ncbi:MAG: phosphatase PAP2 family protein [Gammaproteobacteria bacterium]|nr:phosphatase PAP2 family protein [Gammaproteobacteria bacterium]MCH9743992.1 phosphatase PAP2 family protein [Gammaproteobacteria bacterium]
MSFKAFFKDYYQHYLAPEYGVKCRVAAVMLVVGAIMYLLNNLFFHYHGYLQLGDLFIKFIVAYVVLFLAAIYVQEKCPRISLFLRAVTEVFFVGLIIQFYVAMVQFTPFPLQDHFFNQVDLWLGYHTVEILRWMHQHKSVFWFFDFVYTKLYIEFLLVPIILALFMLRRQLDIFLLSNLIAALIGFTVYYFLPTTDPAGVIHTIKFYGDQYAIVTQFVQMHHHEPITKYVGGIIGFPSFHVIWSLIAMYAMRKLKILFCMILIFNACIIGSTFLLGWHFLSDVIGGFVVAAMALYLAEKFSNKQDQRELSYFK